ncbi:hypothetical protein AURDEDRAFT_120836 [Auricularia subglabra TFB-10046 SS5]|nr:hypothetical protein AURDEDRAFT_120836 [Auricularia subglabra TFB-10046 SS5]
MLFALGDLAIGEQVGNLVSLELRSRLRADIRDSWRTVDFLTLCRHVLADRNLPGEHILSHYQFRGRFNLENDPSLRCEDGLAAIVKVFPGLQSDDIAEYFPDPVVRLQTFKLLLPYVTDANGGPEVMIVLVQKFWSYLKRDPSFNLEAELYRRLSRKMREDYARKVTVRLNTLQGQILVSNLPKHDYGGHGGPIEILTFVCCDDPIPALADDDDVSYDGPSARMSGTVGRTSAVDLVMSLLQFRRRSEHPCLAYLFGLGELQTAAWDNRDWSRDQLSCLLNCLEPSLRRGCLHLTASNPQPGFMFALARAAVMLLSHSEFSAPSRLNAGEKACIIRLILEQTALPQITAHGRRLSVPVGRETIGYGIRILETITSYVRQLLEGESTVLQGRTLFGLLATSEVKRGSGYAAIWDLGLWLRGLRPDLVPGATQSLQQFHEEMTAIYALRLRSRPITEYWERIGYPGRPGDIFSDPFLDISAFFYIAERERLIWETMREDNLGPEMQSRGEAGALPQQYNDLPPGVFVEDVELPSSMGSQWMYIRHFTPPRASESGEISAAAETLPTWASGTAGDQPRVQASPTRREKPPGRHP